MRARCLLVAFLLLAAGFLLPPAEPVTVFLIGDSTMADKPIEGNPERGWGQLFPSFFDSTVRVTNHARNGRSTRSFLAEDRWRPVMDSLRPGDYVFIQFGHNDQSREKVDRYTPPEDYRANLVRFVSDTRARGGHPVLCTSIVRRRFDDNGEFHDVHGVYPGIVREVAESLDVPLLDMHRKSELLIRSLGPEGSKEIFLWVPPGVYAALPGGKEDNTHFSEVGATAMARLAAEGIRELGLDLAHRLLVSSEGPE